MTMESSGDVLLISKRVEILNKVFFFDFKEQSSFSSSGGGGGGGGGGGQFLMITDKTNSGLMSSIVLPSAAICTFIESFNSCISSNQHKQLLIGTTVFSLDVGENIWGAFLKVSESSVDKYQGTTSIFIPSGRNQNQGWETFGRVLSEISTTSKLIFPPKQQKPDPSEQVVGIPDVSSCIISGQSGESSSASQLKTESESSSSFEISRMMRAGPKKFFFDLQGSKSGPLLKICQVMGTSRSSIFVPLSEVKQFHEMVGDFLKISNGFGEGSSIADGEQSSSPQEC